MFALAFTTFALALSSVSALVVPRASPPTGWDAARFESYDVYHERYMDLECQNKHNTPFFNTCCHPLLVNQRLEDRPAECNPYGDCNDEHDATPQSTPTKPTSTSKPAPKASPTSAPKQPPVNAGVSVNTGGFATYFYQNGVAGACGTVHSDNDFVAAMDYRRYGNLSVKSGLCGKRVQITNPANGKSVVVTVADACPTCNNANSIDLSLAAFKAIAPLSQGLVKINWKFV